MTIKKDVLDKLCKLADDYMKLKNSSKVCLEVSELISNNEPSLNVLKNFLLILDTNEGINNNGHVVNISEDKEYIYDFTGDQYYLVDTSKLWVYKKIKPGIYCSKNGMPSDLPSNVTVELNDFSIMTLCNNKENYRVISFTNDTTIEV